MMAIIGAWIKYRNVFVAFLLVRVELVEFELRLDD